MNPRGTYSDPASNHDVTPASIEDDHGFVFRCGKHSVARGSSNNPTPPALGARKQEHGAFIPLSTDDDPSTYGRASSRTRRGHVEDALVKRIESAYIVTNASGSMAGGGTCCPGQRRRAPNACPKFKSRSTSVHLFGRASNRSRQRPRSCAVPLLPSSERGPCLRY